MNLESVSFASRLSRGPQPTPSQESGARGAARSFRRFSAIEPLEARIAPAKVFVIDGGGLNLSSFDSATPTTALPGGVAITGLAKQATGEILAGIDFRPATGELYGLGIFNGAGANDTEGRVYKIDTTTGIATQVGSTPFSSTLIDGASYGFDFNPTVDRIRIVNSADQNLRVNPNNGARADVPTNDTALDNAAGTEDIVGSAYDRNSGGPALTTLFGIDFVTDTLVRQGGVDGTPSPNAGGITPIGALGVNVATGAVGFDILGANTAFAGFTDQGSGLTGFYSIALGTGLATKIGNINAGTVPIGGLAVQTDSIVVAGTAGDDTLVVTATDSNSGSYVLNGGTPVPFTGIASFTFHGAAGSDKFSIINPAASVFGPANGVFYNGGTGGGTLTTVLSENFDGVVAPALPAGWTAINNQGAGPWGTSATGSNSGPNDAFASTPATVTDKLLDTPTIHIGDAGPQLTFKNNYIFNDITSGFDGGVLEISINGGAFTDIITAGGSFVSGGYNGTISVSFASPIAGRMAWTGTSAGGYIDTVVNLPAAAVGQDIKLQWRSATDNSVSSTGWRIDDVKVTDIRESDALEISGGGGAAFSEHYTVINPKDGALVTTNGTVTQTINFTGLEPVTTVVPVGTFDIDLTGMADTVNITNGPLFMGFQTTVVGDGPGGNYEDVTFANKTTVNVNGLNGGDTLSVNNSTPATGLTTLNLYGNQLSGAADDNAADLFSLSATAATVSTNFLGQGGTDIFRHIITQGANLDNVLGPVSFSGGTSAADNDALVLQDTLAGAADNVTLSSTQITGLAPATLTYDTIERVFIETTSFKDNVDILSTNLGTSYSVAGDGDSDTFTIGNTTAAFNTGPGTGDLANIQGLLVISPDSNLTAGTADVINVDDSGSTTALAAASISNIGSTTVTTPLDNTGITVTSTANTTELAGFAPAAIRYFHDTVTGSLPSPNNRLEMLSVRGSQGNDTIAINATTAITQTTVDAREGNDLLTLAGGSLSAGNVFQGFSGHDEFTLNIATNIGATAFAPVTSVQIEGNAPSDTVNRDRLTINDSDIGRSLNYAYLSQTMGDLDIQHVAAGSGLFGAADLDLKVRSMETVVFNATTNNDTVSVSGTSGNDVLTVGLLNNNTSALVFLGGTPYLGTAPVTLANSRPGVAGGGFGPDVYIKGMTAASGLTLTGGGFAGTGGDRAVVYAASEDNLTDVGNPTDIFGFGAGVLIPGFGAGLAYDTITVDDTKVNVTSFASGPLTPVFLNTASFVQGTPLNPAQQKALIVNAGDEAAAQASGIADDITGTLSTKFGIAVNGGNPVSGGANPFAGDRLSLVTPAEVSVFSDTASPPNVTITSGGSAGFGFSSIENVTFTPGIGSQVVNLIGDNNNPAIDQKDNFVVNGNFILPNNQRADVDGNLAPIAGAQNEFQPDSDGDNEFYLFLNGNSPIGFRNVRTVNSFGDDQNPAPGTPSVGANGEDTLNVTPYADNTSNSRQWDIGVNFDEGNPSPGGILILNGVAGVPETVVVKKNGPEAGTVTDTHATSNQTIVVINYTHVSTVIVNQNPNEGDTKTGGGANFGFPGIGSNAFTAGLVYDLTQPVPLPGKSIAGKGSSAVAVGDVNGDMIPDFVTANSLTNNVSILLGKGDGTFGVPKNISSGGKKPSDIALADLENDGDLDIVVTNAGSKSVAVIKNTNGLGSFGTPALTALKLAPTSLAVGDLTGDNLPDVAVTHVVGSVSVLLNNAGTLGSLATVGAGGKGTSDVVIADFNNDGKADLAVANPVSGNVSFLQNAGGGVFNIAPQIFTMGVRPSGLAVADFNNDGKLDLAVSHTVSRFVGILLGNGGSPTQFQPALHVNFPGRHFPKAIAAGDFNGDGKADLALGPREGAKLRILLGAGQGDFSQPFEFDLGREEGKVTRVVSGIALADVNRDGELDIVTSNTSPSNDVSVLLRNLA
ncbi:MAG: large repetitive protein [Chthoniobacter sp.]|jgi:hypothetical protein|nr:large repetitive protein [Chthoniobacter sp.]